MEETIQNASQSSIEIYVAPDNSIQLQVKLDQDTVWLTVDQMAMLFDRDVKTIRKHINNALREELDKSLVVAKFASTKKYGRREGYMQEVELDSNLVSSILKHTAADGKRYTIMVSSKQEAQHNYSLLKSAAKVQLFSDICKRITHFYAILLRVFVAFRSVFLRCFIRYSCGKSYSLYALHRAQII